MLCHINICNSFSLHHLPLRLYSFSWGTINNDGKVETEHTAVSVDELDKDSIAMKAVAHRKYFWSLSGSSGMKCPVSRGSPLSFVGKVFGRIPGAMLC